MRSKRKQPFANRERLTHKQRAFLHYLEDLGYELGRDILLQPKEVSVMVNCRSSVFKRYVPAFYVVPELTCYDVDSHHDLDFLARVRDRLVRDGHELEVVTEAEFPFDEYVMTDGR